MELGCKGYTSASRRAKQEAEHPMKGEKPVLLVFELRKGEVQNRSGTQNYRTEIRKSIMSLNLVA